jgi:proliferating cell nuclear antigen
MSNNDTLTIDIADRDYMQLIIENVAKKSSTTYSLKLLDINEDELDVPEIDMDVITTMSSVDFQRITRDMNNLASEINIIREGHTLELSCLGDFANQKTVIEYSDEQDSTQENMPIIFRYTIANLGEIKFYLAPKVE